MTYSYYLFEFVKDHLTDSSLKSSQVTNTDLKSCSQQIKNNIHQLTIHLRGDDNSRENLYHNNPP